MHFSALTKVDRINVSAQAIISHLMQRKKKKKLTSDAKIGRKKKKKGYQHFETENYFSKSWETLYTWKLKCIFPFNKKEEE